MTQFKKMSLEEHNLEFLRRNLQLEQEIEDDIRRFDPESDKLILYELRDVINHDVTMARKIADVYYALDRNEKMWPEDVKHKIKIFEQRINDLRTMLHSYKAALSNQAIQYFTDHSSKDNEESREILDRAAREMIFQFFEKNRSDPIEKLNKRLLGLLLTIRNVYMCSKQAVCELDDMQNEVQSIIKKHADKQVTPGDIKNVMPLSMKKHDVSSTETIDIENIDAIITQHKESFARVVNEAQNAELYLIKNHEIDGCALSTIENEMRSLPQPP